MGFARLGGVNSSRSAKNKPARAYFYGIIWVWGVSSADRALHSHCRGQEFESPTLHHINLKGFIFLDAGDRVFLGEVTDFGADGIEIRGELIEFVFRAGFLTEVGDFFHPFGEFYHFWLA